jgi:hypothetical protein
MNCYVEYLKGDITPEDYRLVFVGVGNTFFFFQCINRVCQVICVTNLVCKRFSCSDPSALDTFWASSIAKDNNQLLDAINPRDAQRDRSFTKWDCPDQGYL